MAEGMLSSSWYNRASAVDYRSNGEWGIGLRSALGGLPKQRGKATASRCTPGGVFCCFGGPETGSR